MKKGRPVGSKNSELPAAPDLLVIPRRIKKEIATLAAASGVSPAQVLIDILDGGLINAREMYRTLIEYRKSLREQLDGVELNDTELLQERTPEELSGSERNGHAENGLGGVTGEPLSNIESTEERLDAITVGPGLSPESDEALAGDRGDAE